MHRGTWGAMASLITCSTARRFAGIPVCLSRVRGSSGGAGHRTGCGFSRIARRADEFDGNCGNKIDLDLSP